MEKVLHISKKVGQVIIWISILALVVMIVVTIADIFMREVFRNPITGSVEIVRMMMICMSPAFISALFLDRHVSVGLFIDRLGRKGQLAFDVFGYGLSAILCAVLAGQGIVDTLKRMAQRQTYTILKIPTWPFYLLFAVSMGLMGIAIVIQLVANFKDKSRYLPQSEASVPAGGDEQ
ncbi:MAG: TRAP transporter small permease [Saccharofermentanales bacterium]|jgi:TRAP-type C4-dicarboxylate transport system permease small subunit